MVLEREDDEVREKIGRFVGACGIEERFEDVENRFTRLEGESGTLEEEASERWLSTLRVSVRERDEDSAGESRRRRMASLVTHLA